MFEMHSAVNDPFEMSHDEDVFYGVNTKDKPFYLRSLSEDQRFAIERAKKYALEQSIQNALNKQAAQMHQNDLHAVKRNQALILLSRIYVGSISFEIGEDEIRKTFSPFGPIRSIAISWDTALQKHKGFAFIEFEIPDAACLALEQMNGYTLASRNLKVGRPSNAPQTIALENELRSDESLKTRIYVASIHPELIESDLQTVFEAFGKVDCCTLYPDVKSPGLHRGFGYIDFVSEDCALSAVASMNCFDLAGQQLRVGHAITPRGAPLPFEMANMKHMNSTLSAQMSTSAVALAAASISAKVMSMSTEEINALNNGGVTRPSSNGRIASGFSGPVPVQNLPPPGVFIPPGIGEVSELKTEVSNSVQPDDAADETAAPVWDDDDNIIPEHINDSPTNADEKQSNVSREDDVTLTLSRVLLLENMVGVDEVDDDLNEEITEECSNYGSVLRVLIHVTSDKASTPQSVRIFVQFDRSDDAVYACDALNQRYFAGRVVNARLYDEELFQLRQLEEN